MSRLANRVCVVTGAGSVGMAVAARLASEGATVAAVDRRQHQVGDRSLVADLSVEAEVGRRLTHCDSSAIARRWASSEFGCV
jgi:NAD(P)-dependent dehydrogenase (short-subunit alcohol dehydrogenase family)